MIWSPEGQTVMQGGWEEAKILSNFGIFDRGDLGLISIELAF